MPKINLQARDLRGIFPALFTPLKRDDPKCLNNAIDYEKAKIMMDDLIGAGVHGLVPIGTTGQSATVTPQQHIDFLKFAIDYAGDRVPIIAGAGSNCTRESIETINNIQSAAGTATFLCVTGYYNNPPQEGLIEHFKTLSKETGANLIIYNVPGRTNSYLEADTLIELARNKSIIGLKQAVDFKNPGFHREQTLKVVENTSADEFAVLTGEDDSLLSLLEMGGAGMITATGNIPEAAGLFCRILSAFDSHDGSGAARLEKETLPFVKACFLLKNPIPLAFLFNSPVYRPLVSVENTHGGKELVERLKAFMESHAPSLKKYF